MAKFFVSCQLGFEQALEQELKSFWFEMIDLDGLPTRSNPPECEVHKGGLEFETAEHLGFQINFFSKLANRVLLRIDKFNCRYFDQFEKNFAKTPVEKYLSTDILNVKVESHKSRINNEKSILEACVNVLKKKNIRLVDTAAQTVFIRIEKDDVTISLDTSGEHLHKRSYAEQRGEAPLRETLAAYMVMKLLKYEPLTVLDPFTGSGTLLLEACSQKLPNFSRKYAWFDFKNAPKLFKSPTWAKNYQWFENIKTPACYGYDIDAKSIESFKHNLKNFSEQYKLLNLKIQIAQKDSLQLSKEDFKDAPWVIANPPYGIRMKEEKAPQILHQLSEFVAGMVVIHPQDWKLDFKNLKLVESEDFNNQGIRLKLSVFARI